ncbi:methylated-DNA-protein-cysteine methyltransferase related protein [Malassezia restricta]|uniref:methylated-DNA-protein-cysteine methyltransferase related protein n=1 Tax=Malassezia restricta TaxID=76775 RepID=UPI000DD11F0F|nr:methylated-DNA-protein-cysteine methyltransferase related protein [Malassezia restricta]AXA49846.1 methylated-DNA-protein-cysteine methyltransferase related protein [Malassezia restricta]
MSLAVSAGEFHAMTYECVTRIPYGHVTSYGHIAKLIGYPQHSRMVGAALKFLQNDRVPWHRVVRADGSIAERGDGGAGASRQAQRLMSEGVPVSEIPLGSAVTQWRVQSMASNSGYGWFPTTL